MQRAGPRVARRPTRASRPWRSGSSTRARSTTSSPRGPLTRTDWEAATELQSVGVAASPVLDAWDVVADPHLAARDFFHALPHARFARDLVFGQAVRLSETPLRAERAAPAFGQRFAATCCASSPTSTSAAIERLIEDGTVQVMERGDVVFERPYLHWIRKVQRLLPWGTPTFDPATEMMRTLEAPASHDRHRAARRSARRRRRRRTPPRTPAGCSPTSAPTSCSSRRHRSPARRVAPNVRRPSGDTVSAHFAFMAAGKRSVTIDLTAARRTTALLAGSSTPATCSITDRRRRRDGSARPRVRGAAPARAAGWCTRRSPRSG